MDGIEIYSRPSDKCMSYVKLRCTIICFSYLSLTYKLRYVNDLFLKLVTKIRMNFGILSSNQ